MVARVSSGGHSHSSLFAPAAHLLNLGFASSAPGRPTNFGQLPPSDSSSVAAVGAATFSLTIASRAVSFSFASR